MCTLCSNPSSYLTNVSLMPALESWRPLTQRPASFSSPVANFDVSEIPLSIIWGPVKRAIYAAYVSHNCPEQLNPQLVDLRSIR